MVLSRTMTGGVGNDTTVPRDRRSMSESQILKSEKRSKYHGSHKLKNKYIFQSYYADLCTVQNFPMLYGVKAHLHKRILDFNGDRVKLDEWRPILKALSLDRSLHFIAIRSRHSNSQILEQIDTEAKARSIVKKPVLITRFILKRLTDSVSRCLTYNNHLTCIELDGLLLTGEYIDTFAVGLRKSASLQHLSLHRCPITDQGCQLICSCLRNLPCVVSLDLSGCDISAKGAHSISKTLQYQNLNRYGENWKQSLRYRTPNADMMPGLRRVTLNHNPRIGDVGVQELLDVIRDDLWLKALDLQNVGMTCNSGTQVLELLHVNTCLAIIDVRNNPGIGTDLLAEIMYQLACNNVNKIPEYHWLTDDAVCLPHKPSYINCNTIFGKRSSRLRLPSQGKSTELLCTGRSQSRSANVHVTKSNILPAGNPPMIQLRKTSSAGAPSRIATRLNRRRELQAQVTSGVPNMLQFEAVTPTHSDGILEVASLAAGDSNMNPTCLVQAKKQLLELSAHLEEEILKREAAERKKDDLQAKLNRHLQELSHIQKAMIGRILVDKKVIEDANSAITDFNRFLAVVKKLGLSDLFKSSDSSSSLKSSLSESNTSPAFSPSEQCDSTQLTYETNEHTSESNLSLFRNNFNSDSEVRNESREGVLQDLSQGDLMSYYNKLNTFSTPPGTSHSHLDFKQLSMKLDEISKERKNLSQDSKREDLTSFQLSKIPLSVPTKDQERATNNFSLFAIQSAPLQKWLMENDISDLSSLQRDLIEENLRSAQIFENSRAPPSDHFSCENNSDLKKSKEETEDCVLDGENGSEDSSQSWSTLMPDSNSECSDVTVGDG